MGNAAGFEYTDKHIDNPGGGAYFRIDPGHEA